MPDPSRSGDAPERSTPGPSGTDPSPSGVSGVPDAPPDRVGQAFDLVTYVLALTAAFAAVSAAGALALGARVAPGVKYGFFVLGWLAFGYGTLLLLPSRPWKDSDDESVFGAPDEDRGDSAFQRAVQWLPPARFRPLEPDRRLPTGLRIFVASVVVLATSFVLEQAFGVGP